MVLTGFLVMVVILVDELAERPGFTDKARATLSFETRTVASDIVADRPFPRPLRMTAGVGVG